MQPEESLAISERVKDLLRRNDIGDRKQAGQLSLWLKISPQSAYKKLGGQMQWSLDDVLAIAGEMGVRPGTLLDDSEDGRLEPALLVCNGVKLDCLVRTGEVAKPMHRAQYVAFREGDRWQVYVRSQSPNPGGVVVEEIVIRPPKQDSTAPRIAIIDDDRDTAELIASFLENEGFNTVTLRTVNELRYELQQQPIDGYIIDWYLGGATGEDCVRLIRQSTQNKPPILLLTGNIDTGLASESDIARVMVEFELKHPFEKPYRPTIIAAELIKELGKGPQESFRSSR